MNSTSKNTNATNNTNNASSSNNSCHNSVEKLNGDTDESVVAQHHQTPPQRSTSSSETLAASEGVTLCNGLDPNSPLSKPLPPLPTKNTTKLANHTTSSSKMPNSTTNNTDSASTNSPANHKLAANTNLNNSQAHLASQGIHHAQPYYQTPPTPTLMGKRDYQQPPPVPPHQNNNHAAAAHHHLPPSGHQPTLTPCLDQQRRTLDRSMRNLPYSSNETNMNLEGLTTRIPSLRRTRRSSGSSSNNIVNAMCSNPNGGLGIPITVAAGSPRVQRSPMPARAAMMKQRSRLGSHNDNISSGSLNSIEV